MAGKTLINGTAYTINGGRTLIGGTGYDIKSGKTLIGGTGQTISFGTPVGSLAVGTSLWMNYNGYHDLKQEFIVIHQGLPSSIYDSSCNGTWVMFKEMISQNDDWGDEDVGNYANSLLTSSLNSTYFAKFDSVVQNIVKSVKIPYVSNYSSGTVTSGSNGLSCKMFLLSAVEIGFTSAISSIATVPADGTKLDYFESGESSSANSKRVCYWGPETHTWWTRSPRVANWTGIICAYGTGESTFNAPDTAYGVRPAFILPSNTLIDGTYISLT